MTIKNSILYLYGFSLTSSKRLNEFMKILKEQLNSDFDINIVMIHDAVIGTTKDGKIPAILKELLKFPIKIYALIPDIIARGMDHKNLIDKIKEIEYDGLIDLLIDTNKIVSWM